MVVLQRHKNPFAAVEGKPCCSCGKTHENSKKGQTFLSFTVLTVLRCLTWDKHLLFQEQGCFIYVSATISFYQTSCSLIDGRVDIPNARVLSVAELQNMVFLNFY